MIQQYKDTMNRIQKIIQTNTIQRYNEQNTKKISVNELKKKEKQRKIALIMIV